MYNAGPRFVVLVVMTFIQIRQLTANYQLAMPLDVDLNKMLYGHSLVNISGLTMENCLEQCLENCLCLSFQMCGDGNECQLCSSNKYFNPQAMQKRKGCTSYNFRDRSGGKVSNQQCDSLMSIFNCCLKSKPCINGGTCLPTLSSSMKNRFKCQCPDGYTGLQCEHLIRSCRGYSSGNGIPGKYTVFDANNNTFKVFCHFDRRTSITWTLVQSYSLANNDLFRSSEVLPLSKDSAQNENNPSLLQYRLSKSRMESIQKDSTKWGHTYHHNEVDHVPVFEDYFCVSNTEHNILEDNGKCIKVEYMKIGNYSCTDDCTIYMSPVENIMLFYESVEPKHSICDIKTASNRTCGILYEHSIGLYQSQHLTSPEKRTSQIWFGAES